MGGSLYDGKTRGARAVSSGFYTKSRDDIFEQNKKREIHESMIPANAKLREARDSEIHPQTVPIIIGLDVTGSMGKIPHDLIKDGLPTIMSGIMEKGIKSPALLFIAIGDIKSDKFPLQVGQFESGDAELDTWLTRTYLEGGGGGNGGESYFLAWYYAAYHTVTDAWEKRKQKGFIFTIGDEPCNSTLPDNVLRELMGLKEASTYLAEDLLKSAQEKWNVYHIHTRDGSYWDAPVPGWERVLGENCIVVKNYTDISKTIAEIVIANTPKSTQVSKESNSQETSNNQDQEIIL